MFPRHPLKLQHFLFSRKYFDFFHDNVCFALCEGRVNFGASPTIPCI